MQHCQCPHNTIITLIDCFKYLPRRCHTPARRRATTTTPGQPPPPPQQQQQPNKSRRALARPWHLAVSTPASAGLVDCEAPLQRVAAAVSAPPLQLSEEREQSAHLTRLSVAVASSVSSVAEKPRAAAKCDPPPSPCQRVQVEVRLISLLHRSAVVRWHLHERSRLIATSS